MPTPDNKPGDWRSIVQKINSQRLADQQTQQLPQPPQVTAQEAQRKSEYNALLSEYCSTGIEWLERLGVPQYLQTMANDLWVIRDMHRDIREPVEKFTEYLPTYEQISAFKSPFSVPKDLCGRVGFKVGIKYLQYGIQEFTEELIRRVETPSIWDSENTVWNHSPAYKEVLKRNPIQIRAMHSYRYSVSVAFVLGGESLSWALINHSARSSEYIFGGLAVYSTEWEHQQAWKDENTDLNEKLVQRSVDGDRYRRVRSGHFIPYQGEPPDLPSFRRIPFYFHRDIKDIYRCSDEILRQRIIEALVDYDNMTRPKPSAS